MMMIDMGVESKNTKLDCVPTANGESKKGEKMYPSFSVYDKAPGFLTDKDVGVKCRIEMEIEITGKSMREGKDEEHTTVDMRILKMGYIGKGGKKTKEEYLGMSDDEREKYDKEDKEIE